MIVPLKSESVLTVIIPTRNRPVFLNRLMKYYRNLVSKHRLIIADSSDTESFEEAKHCLASLVRDYPIDHLEFPSGIPFELKLQQAYDRVDTPFVVTGSDDDFHIPKALQSAVTFLQSHNDYSVVHGDAALFSLSSAGAYGRIHSVGRYDQRSIEGLTGAKRLLDNLGQYSTNWYSVQRTKHLQESYAKVAASGWDSRFTELAASCLSIIKGKAKKLDCLFMVRQAHTGMTSVQENSVSDMFDWVSDPAWSIQYQKMRDCLAEELAAQDHISEDLARGFVKKAFWSFTAIGLKSKWASTYREESSELHSRLRRIAVRIPALRRAQRQVRSFLPGEENEVSLPALLRPGSKHHSDFMPIYRAITEVPSKIDSGDPEKDTS